MHTVYLISTTDRAPMRTCGGEVGNYSPIPPPHLPVPQYPVRSKQPEHFITAPYHMHGRGKGRKSESRGRGIQRHYNPIRNPGVISPKPRPPIPVKPALSLARSIILVRKKNSRHL